MKVVIYGAAPDDFELVSHLALKAELVLEKQALGENTFHPDANIIVVFPNSSIEKRHITPNLRAIVSRATGTDHIKCLSELEELNIPVLRPKGYATQSVAEYSLSAISRELSKNYFDSRGKQAKTEISSQNVVVVGAGEIGKRLKTILDVIGCETALVSLTSTEDTYPYTKLDELVTNADFICLHTSLRDVNVKLLNKKNFAHIKRGAVIINAARGEMVDNEALLEALDHGKISSAYLDLVVDDNFSEKVINHSKVIYTNHTAWRTEAALRKSQYYLVSTLERLIKTNQSS